MAPVKVVSYLRVSTAKQGRSGLGLEAQRSAVEAFLNGGRWRLIAELVEVESGKQNERPALAKALATCRLHGAKLVVAKLDRLSRNAAFLLTLRDAGVEFVAVDMPDANRMTVGIMAVIAEHEREMISARTKAALAQARRRGKRIGGNPQNLSRSDRRRGSRLAAEARRAAALQRAQELEDVIGRMRRRGASLREIASWLAAEEIPTPRGGTWTADAVRRALLLIGMPAA